MVFTVDWIEGSKKPETSVLYACGFGWQFISRVNKSLPSQRQPPGLDSARRVIIPRGAKLDVLSHLVIREDSLYPFIELLGKRC